MKNTITKIGLLYLFLWSSYGFQAQIGATDTSEKSVKRHQNLIRNNKEIVAFIEYTMVKKGLPKHLRNLALIESGFDRTQTSSAGAQGIWQLMEGHANDYGLSSQERSDIYRSTKAAAISLSNLYKKYGNWLTVVAAYNCGEGNVQKAMQRAGSTRYSDFYTFLPNETINHVFKYLNACYATGEINNVLEDFKASNLTKRSISAQPKSKSKNSNHGDMVSFPLNSGYQLEVIAKTLNVSTHDLLAWNPGIEEEINKNGESDFYLPVDLMTTFKVNQNKILQESMKY